MQVFLCHADMDKEIVEPIASWLEEQGFEVWLDKWRLTPGDSLIDKIGEALESSDRLIVFLSPNSVESNWVRKEVATGLVMEIAEDKGLGEKFVIPALLVPCKVPILLREKLYANFTNKTFQAACEELARGLRDQALGTQAKTFENRLVRKWDIPARKPDKHGLVIEFGVLASPTVGLHAAIDVGSEYDSIVEWFGPPNTPTVPAFGGNQFLLSSERRAPPIFEHRFQSPNITSQLSYYVYFEASKPFNVRGADFLDFYGREP